MRALKCDLCGNYFDYDKDHTGILIKRRGNGEPFTSDLVILSPSDICPDCYNAIMKTIDERKQKKECHGESGEKT